MFWVCLSAAVVLGLRDIWDIVGIPEITRRVPRSAILIAAWTGSYIAVRDALSRIKAGRNPKTDEKSGTESLERTMGGDEHAK